MSDLTRDLGPVRYDVRCERDGCGYETSGGESVNQEAIRHARDTGHTVRTERKQIARWSIERGD